MSLQQEITLDICSFHKKRNTKLLKVKCVMVYYLLEEGLCMCTSDCTCGWHRLPLKVQSIGLDSCGHKYSS